MGLIVDIYRSDYNSPLNIFGGVKQLTVVNIAGPFDPTPDAPAAFLGTNPYGDPVIKPVVDGTTDVPLNYVAFGGSYAATSDSRFLLAVNFHGAVPIHDYDLSRDTQSGD